MIIILIWTPPSQNPLRVVQQTSCHGFILHLALKDSLAALIGGDNRFLELPGFASLVAQKAMENPAVVKNPSKEPTGGRVKIHSTFMSQFIRQDTVI